MGSFGASCAFRGCWRTSLHRTHNGRSPPATTFWVRLLANLRSRDCTIGAAQELSRWPSNTIDSSSAPERMFGPFEDGRGVSVIGGMERCRDDDAGVEIDRVLGLVGTSAATLN